MMVVVMMVLVLGDRRSGRAQRQGEGGCQGRDRFQ
jgi:hypothetical protein